MRILYGALLGAASLLAVGAAQAEKLSIATVNNGGMIRMWGLTEEVKA